MTRWTTPCKMVVRPVTSDNVLRAGPPDPRALARQRQEVVPVSHRLPTRRQSPRMPLRMSITAANTVSRASAAVLGPPLSISETMSATSITVIANASIKVLNGSPTLWATTSAWCTAANTVVNNSTTKAGTQMPLGRPELLAPKAIAPVMGTAMTHLGRDSRSIRHRSLS